MPIDREEHISEKARQKARINPTHLEDLSALSIFHQDALIMALDHCIRCNTCKYAYGPCTPACPSGENFLWESYWASGRIRLARALITGKLQWSEDVLDPIYSCPTCGACTDNCQAVHRDSIVDIIEALRELAVKKFKCPERQQKLQKNIHQTNNPYGEAQSPIKDLKAQHNLPEKADVVYFIGCTSQYRQKELRDATLSVLKKLGINFTIIDEQCCSSPLIRTGQLNETPALMSHNIAQFKASGAKTIITSCAGCYRTLTMDFPHYAEALDPAFQVMHISEFLREILPHRTMRKLTRDLLGIKSSEKEFSQEIVATYHDPCHLGHHMAFFEPPRDLIRMIPSLKFVEIPRNRESAWCCGAGGGVKIGYPEFATITGKKRIEEVKTTGAELLLSTCPFCKTNLSDSNDEPRLLVRDLIQILDLVL